MLKTRWEWPLARGIVSSIERDQVLVVNIASIYHDFGNGIGKWGWLPINNILIYCPKTWNLQLKGSLKNCKALIPIPAHIVDRGTIGGERQVRRQPVAILVHNNQNIESVWDWVWVADSSLLVVKLVKIVMKSSKILP